MSEIFCTDCGERIEQDDPYWEIDGKCYCEDCLDDHKHYADYWDIHIPGRMA